MLKLLLLFMMLQRACQRFCIKGCVLSLMMTIFLTGHVCAQEDSVVFLENYISLDTTIMIASNTIAYSPRVASCAWNEDVYITDYYITDCDTMFVYKINTQTGVLTKLCFVIDGFSCAAREENYSGVDYIACNDNVFVAAFGRHIYYTSLESPIRFKHIKLENTYQNAKFDILGDLVLYRYYWGNDVPTELSLFDIKKETIIKTVCPEGGNMMTSYIGGTHLFDVNDRRIIFGRPNEFVIDVYDLSLNKVGCVSFREGKTVIEESLLEEAKTIHRNDASARLALFSPLDYDLMLWAYLTDKDIIPVYRTKASEDRFSLHTIVNVFRQNEGSSWNHVLVDAIDRMLKGKNEIVTKSTVPVDWIGGNDVLFLNNKIVSIAPDGTIGSPVGMTMGEYESECRNWLKSSRYRLQVNIFSFYL